MQRAFEIELSDIEVERYVQIANQQVAVKGIARIRKGWIDAVFNDLIFEFKRDLVKEEAEGQRKFWLSVTLGMTQERWCQRISYG